MPSVANNRHPLGRERGVVLPVALFILVAATLLTLGLIRSNVMALKIGGVSVVGTENETAAELLLSNFFAQNSLTDANRKQRYMQATANCGTAAQIAANTALDCTQIGSSRLPAGVTPATPVTQRIGCAPPPRTSSPTQAGTEFNNVLIETGVTNALYGSQAQVGAGVAAFVLTCPQT